MSDSPIEGEGFEISEGPGRAVLSMSDVRASYPGVGEEVLRGITLTVQRGEIVCLVGANGAGKSTVLRTVSGLTTQSTGAITLDGVDIVSMAADRRAKLGIAHVPQGRSAVPFLSVRENLELGFRILGSSPGARSKREGQLARVLERIPDLKARLSQRAGTLSGGQQQMVELGRALISNPVLVMLDEPSLGLAPQIVQRTFSLVQEMAQSGLSVLIVEQRVKEGLELADTAYVLGDGRVIFSGPSEEVASDPRLSRVYLGGVV